MLNEFARKYFNGGGHTNAAGGRSSLTLDKTITEFISILPSHKKELTESFDKADSSTVGMR